jgi:hypothetical protein
VPNEIRAPISAKHTAHRNVYGNFMEISFATELSITIRTRLTDLFAPHSLDFNNLIDLDACFALLRKMRTSDAMTILKTWTNSWATSHRSHDPGGKLPCLLGCRAQKDSLIHYLQCPYLFSLMQFFNRSTDCNPLVRFGLVKPNLDCLSLICMASAGYHAVRRNVRKTSFRPVDMELTSSDVRRFWTVFAEAFTAEAREHNASCTKFSVPDFLSFLIASDQDQT